MTAFAAFLGYCVMGSCAIGGIMLVIGMTRESLNTPAHVRYRVCERRAPARRPGQDVDVYGGAVDEGERASGLYHADRELSAAADRVAARERQS